MSDVQLGAYREGREHGIAEATYKLEKHIAALEKERDYL